MRKPYHIICILQNQYAGQETTVRTRHGTIDWFKTGKGVHLETPVLWPPCAESWLIGKDSDARRDWGQEEKGMIGKDSDAGRDWGQEEKRMTEDEMAGWHHQLDGRRFEWTPGVGDGQEGLACCNSWGRNESDTTEWLNWTELKQYKWGYLRNQKLFPCPAWLMLSWKKKWYQDL